MTTPGAQFEVFSLFPEMFEAFSSSGLLGKAVQRSLVSIHVTNYRDFTRDTHRTVDDAPFGGGGGMVIKAEPVVAAMERVERERGPFHRVLLTPSAPTFDQIAARRLAELPRIGLLCGRYEGIDDRVREHYVDECLSIGDFVLNGGEVAAAAIIEAVSRLREGVLGNPASAEEDSFSAGALGPMLEHPHYTRPLEFRDHTIPDVLAGGDHGAIRTWRNVMACARTWALRPRLRPRRDFPDGHPFWLVVDDVVDAARVARLSTDALAGVMRGARRRDVVRDIRRSAGAIPHFVALGQDARIPLAHARHSMALADLIRVERGDLEADLPPIALVWPPDLARRMGATLSLAPNAQNEDHTADDGDPSSVLATSGAMIDIAQPRSGSERTALARRLLRALEDSGLV